MNTVIERPALLSSRLKIETADLHELMHALMEQGQPFANRDNYARFVAAQYHFQRDIEHLFADPAIQAAVPDLDVRGRAAASLADLADLGFDAVPEPAASAGVAMPGALGWLYVSEGSTLGAAFLLKQAKARLGLSETFGARNLAAYPEGRAIVWRRFVGFLDRPALQEQEHDAVIAGAAAAYARFGSLLKRHFGLA
ncbi:MULTISPECIES: biliverdin-producing heme oxygenase [unclassified Herbaspirillum]|uniref:biliverdin-producing heme oxygenase n=1 Tax=unclassified Herbaspirillum TaxID=2624150 RepID=UPI0011509F7D|nr:MULTISPECIES: biliverdin-producing heme oxygenase [unclassified Herbaspirillum]MBB5390014.1 heme oxygenase [Herbaspirillum sp. SJZ102]TQK09484.1 heme oxygenase [Herbaspirillum sp. SJZ130]TQK13829.1 heme oxygenase [Herbaspirillum sp. SJZ106]TWC69552.1 heme oxygenase [Herbaspirillum sp. SJZ099]